MTENKDVNIGIFSFFAGAGFLDLGFENTKGFETLFVNEYHEPFMDIYKYTRKSIGLSDPKFGYHVTDIVSFNSGENKKILQDSIQLAINEKDLIGFIGGPPCPDFSVGGKNKGEDGENGKLSATYINLIIDNKPDFFLFENVKGLYRTKKHREFFEKVKSKLVKNGYFLTEKLINAIEYGAPQDRERIILIGFKKTTLKKLNPKATKKWFTETFDWDSKSLYTSEQLSRIKWPTQEEFIEDSFKECPENIIPELTVEYWFNKNDVYNHPNSSFYFTPRAGLPKFQSIQEGDDLKKSYKRLHRWRYSPTAAYGNNEVHLHPYKARRLSASEALAIQSLPKDFILPSNMTLSNIFKTIGNGVPYLAAKGLAETIISFIEILNQKTKIYEEVNCE